MNPFFSHIPRHALFVLFAASLSLPAGASVRNPGFENDGLTGWQSFGGEWRAVADDRACDGAASALHALGTSDSEYRGLVQSVAASPGMRYHAAACLRATELNGGATAFLEVQFLDADGTVLTQYQSRPIPRSGLLKADLRNLPAPPGTASASIRGIVHLTDPRRPGPGAALRLDAVRWSAAEPPRK